MIKIIDLSSKYESLYASCLHGQNSANESLCNAKLQWYHRMKPKGITVKLALDDRGEAGGMIQYAPSEESFVLGKNLMILQCIWVLNEKKGRGNFQKKGMGKALLKAFEEDARQKNKDGIVVWGLSIPVFMRASWFKKQGYIVADKMGIQTLLWKKLNTEASPPEWMRQKKGPFINQNNVTVTCFKNGWCTEINRALSRAKEVVSEYEKDVKCEVVDTSEADVMRIWGISDALFIGSKEIPTGPAPEKKKIRKEINKAIKELHKKKENK
ncbi:MAG: GNAT family N-acetyltransferase [Spirochaetales bacterium]|nr:GNAT family N-acetyltransferase [Spirochaetales bacterium]